MSEDRRQFVAAFRRASIGLAIVAVGWAVAILLANEPDRSPFVWAIPIAAAILSVIFNLQTRDGADHD